MPTYNVYAPGDKGPFASLEAKNIIEANCLAADCWPDLKYRVKMKQSKDSVTPYPRMGLDLDGLFDEYPIFFKTIASHWPGKVYIITYRDNRETTEAYIKAQNIRCDELILVNSFEEKAEVIERENICLYFDDQPEMLQNVSSNCAVMLVRNGGNFDYEDKKWMFSEKTGKMV